jgi:tetratricopeptide (TPR) repeat protein
VAEEHGAFARATVLQKEGKFKEAIDQYRQGLLSEKVGRSLRAGSLFNIGSCYMQLGDYQSALSVYSRLNAREDRELQLNVAICQIKLGMTPNAAGGNTSRRLVTLMNHLNRDKDRIASHNSPEQTVGLIIPPFGIIQLMRESNNQEKSGDINGAINSLQIISHSRAFSNDANILCRLGRLHELIDDNESARNYFSESKLLL